MKGAEELLRLDTIQNRVPVRSGWHQCRSGQGGTGATPYGCWSGWHWCRCQFSFSILHFPFSVSVHIMTYTCLYYHLTVSCPMSLQYSAILNFGSKTEKLAITWLLIDQFSSSKVYLYYLGHNTLVCNHSVFKKLYLAAILENQPS